MDTNTSPPAYGSEAERAQQLGRETAELFEKLVNCGIQELENVGVFLMVVLEGYLEQRREELLNALYGAPDENLN